MPEMILASVFLALGSALKHPLECALSIAQTLCIIHQSCLQHTSGKKMIKPVGLSTSINKDMIVFNNKKLSNGCYISKKEILGRANSEEACI